MMIMCTVLRLYILAVSVCAPNDIVIIFVEYGDVVVAFVVLVLVNGLGLVGVACGINKIDEGE